MKLIQITWSDLLIGDLGVSVLVHDEALSKRSVCKKVQKLLGLYSVFKFLVFICIDIASAKIRPKYIGQIALAKIGEPVFIKVASKILKIKRIVYMLEVFVQDIVILLRFDDI